MTPTTSTTTTTESFRSYDLGHVRAGYRLLLNKQAFRQAYIGTIFDGERHVVSQTLFSGNELALLLPLIASLPDYCPHEVLYAIFYYSATDEAAVARARETILAHLDRHEAEAEPGRGMGGREWYDLVRPLRNTISRLRAKLRESQVDVVLFFHTGYLLQPYEKTYRSRRAEQGLLPQE